MNINKNYIFRAWEFRGVYDCADVAIKLRAMLPPCSRFLTAADPVRAAYDKSREQLLQCLTTEFLNKK